MEEHEKIQLRSEEVQEILGTPPRWIIRNGNILILVVLVVIFVLAYFFRYPDKINAPIIVTTTVPPIDIIAEKSGYLTDLSVTEGDTVMKGDVLAVIQNTADYIDILFLEDRLEEINWDNPRQVARFEIDDLEESRLKLGDVQSSYSSFVQKYKEISFKKNQAYHKDRIAQLKKNEQKIRKIIKRQNGFKKLAQEEVLKKEQEGGRKRKLLTEGLISRNEYDVYLTEFSEAKKNVKRIEETIDQHELDIQGLRNQMAEIRANTQETDSNKFVELQENLRQVKNSIIEWKQANLLTANRSGVVSFFNEIWSQEQYIKAGEALMAIVPLDKSEESNELIGKLALPVVASGKVDTMQRVLIKFESYPYQEFGVVEGRIVSKSKVPKDKVYNIEVSVPQDLTTSYGKQLRFEQEMEGMAEIITKDKRFIERIMEKLISVFRNS